MFAKTDPSARLKIISLDPRDDVRVIAQFNPKEVQIDKSIPWQEHHAQDGSRGLEYAGGGGARTISLELLFDGAEQARSVRPELDALHKLTENYGTKGKEMRPPRVLVIWGSSGDSEAIPNFPAVIESLSVKYTMFSSTGKVLRATASVKLKEAGTLSIKKAG